MKKKIYIVAFTILGVLVNLLVHAMFEIPLLKLQWSGIWLIPWERWLLYHSIGTVLLLFAGIVFGYRQGTYWWQRIYIDKDVPWKKKRHVT